MQTRDIWYLIESNGYHTILSLNFSDYEVNHVTVNSRWFTTEICIYFIHRSRSFNKRWSSEFFLAFVVSLSIDYRRRWSNSRKFEAIRSHLIELLLSAVAPYRFRLILSSHLLSLFEEIHTSSQTLSIQGFFIVKEYYYRDISHVGCVKKIL